MVSSYPDASVFPGGLLLFTVPSYPESSCHAIKSAWKFRNQWLQLALYRAFEGI